MFRILCRSRSVCAAGVLVLCALATDDAEGTVRAHFEAYSIFSGCLVDDEDPFPLGDPERYFRMAVFDAAASGVLSSCADGCPGDSNPLSLDGQSLDYCSWSTGCSTWNFEDQEISKVIPPQSGAYFYFGLFDEDTGDDDSLGDHWFFANGPETGTANNNNISPYYPGSHLETVCSRDVVGTGSSNNFTLSYAVWFTDSTGPAPASHSHFDSSANSGYNDDSLLQYTWSSGSDPDSGISAHRISLVDVTTGSQVLDSAIGSGGSLSICSGCSRA